MTRTDVSQSSFICILYKANEVIILSTPSTHNIHSMDHSLYYPSMTGQDTIEGRRSIKALTVHTSTFPVRPTTCMMMELMLMYPLSTVSHKNASPASGLYPLLVSLYTIAHYCVCIFGVLLFH